MDTPDTRLTRAAAAALLNCSLSTLDRLIPPGTPGRHKNTPAYRADPLTQDTVLIDRSVVVAHLSAPGGDDRAE